MKILLNCLPPADIHTPSISLSILKKFMNANDIATEIKYWNFVLSPMLEYSDSEDTEVRLLPDEYEIARKEFGKKRLELLESYAENYLTLDDPMTDELIMAMATQKKSLDKLIVKYYKK